MIPAGLYDLCDPAFYYFLISFSIIIVVGLQNYGQGFNYCIGTQICPTSNIVGIFVVKIMYVLVWTWILNLLCKNGHEIISWIFVLIPILLMFVFLALYISNHYDHSRLFVFPKLF